MAHVIFFCYWCYPELEFPSGELGPSYSLARIARFCGGGLGLRTLLCQCYINLSGDFVSQVSTTSHLTGLLSGGMSKQTDGPRADLLDARPGGFTALSGPQPKQAPSLHVCTAALWPAKGGRGADCNASQTQTQPAIKKT